MQATLSFHDLTFTWPDGDTPLSGLTFDLGPGRYGLVGSNGAGKSTLLRVAAGRLTATSGRVTTTGRIGYLPQDAVTGDTVAAALGVAERLTALEAIEAGSTDPDVFDTVGDDWDVADRSVAVLSRLGLAHLDLDRTVDGLSGGELTMLALGGLLLDRPDVLLLDEPSNNLDRLARRRLWNVIDGFGGLLVLASHDRELLGHVDQIGEVRDGTVRWFGGGFEAYAAAIATEQEAAERRARDAAADLRKQRREWADTQVKLARRARYGKKMTKQKREPKIIMNARKRAAQESAGRLKDQHQQDVRQARERLDAARAEVRDDREIRLDLPKTAVPANRVVLTMEQVRPRHVDLVVDLELRGPERLGLSGPNGSGKSTVLRTALGLLEPRSGDVRLRVPARYLPQRLDGVLDDDRSVIENVRAAAPSRSETELRSVLGRMLFRGRRADQRLGSLSGGERLRATLACALHADVAPQLLALDEPTNHLDLPSIRHLVEALGSFEGALLVISHDERFLDDLELDRAVDVRDLGGTDLAG